MTDTTKVRPTFSIRDLLLISGVMDKFILQSIQDGNKNSPVLLDCMRIKQYCETFQPKAKPDPQAMLASYIAANISDAIGSVNVGEVAATKQEALIAPIPNKDILAVSTTQSPIEREDLTVDQIYDLLSLRDDKERTPQENAWYLQHGFNVKLKRAGLAANKTGISGDDL